MPNPDNAPKERNRYETSSHEAESQDRNRRAAEVDWWRAVVCARPRWHVVGQSIDRPAVKTVNSWRLWGLPVGRRQQNGCFVSTEVRQKAGELSNGFVRFPGQRSLS